MSPRTRKIVQQRSIPRARSAKVIGAKLRVLGSRRGEWSGEVEGRGKVSLRLVFRRGEEERYFSIGSVNLPRLKRTHFGYQGAFPEGRGWTWQIEARSDQVLTH